MMVEQPTIDEKNNENDGSSKLAHSLISQR